MTEDEAKATWEKHRQSILACVDHEGKEGYLPYIMVFQNHNGSQLHFQAPGTTRLTALVLQELLDNCQVVLLTSNSITNKDINLKEDK